MTDKQTAWIQGNLFASDICDRLIRGSKILILSEYEVSEVEDLLKTFKLQKIRIRANDMKLHGLYSAQGTIGGTALNELDEAE